jgi:hypothetical protein
MKLTKTEKKQQKEWVKWGKANPPSEDRIKALVKIGKQYLKGKT